MATRVLTVASMLVVARVLGPTGLGQLAVAQGVLAIASAVSDGGIPTLAQRSIVKRPESIQDIVWSAVIVQALFASILVTAIAWGVDYSPLENDAKRLVVVMLPMLIATALNFSYVLAATGGFRTLSIIRVVAQVFTALLTVSLVLITRSSTWVAVSIWAGVLLSDALCVRVLLRNTLQFSMPKVSVVRQLIRGGWTYLGLATCSQALTHGDILILGATQPADEAGAYAAAYRIIFILLGFIGIVSTVALPELVRRNASDVHTFVNLIDQLVRHLSRISYVVAVLIAATAPWLIDLLYGADYRSSASLLVVLIVALPAAYCNGLLGQGLIAAGNEKAYLLYIATTTVLTLGALLVTVPNYGPIAAAWVVVGGELLTLLLFSRKYVALFGHSPSRELLLQLPWLVTPGALLLCYERLDVDPSFIALVSVWLLGVAAVETFGSDSLTRRAIGRGSMLAALPHGRRNRPGEDPNSRSDKSP